MQRNELLEAVRKDAQEKKTKKNREQLIGLILAAAITIPFVVWVFDLLSK